MNSKFLIIAGTEKAGTTSLFQYLTDAGIFNVSKKKETDYLRRPANEISRDDYVKEFSNKVSGGVYLEGSPGYLADSKIVTKNILKLELQNECFVFLLRSPLSRLKSSFIFHKSRLYLDKSMSFDEYIKLCMDYEAGNEPAINIDSWFLRVPDSGLYFKHISDYVALNINNVFVCSFDDFTANPMTIIKKIMTKLSLPLDFYLDYKFERSNITKGFNNSYVQYVALKVNRLLEPIFFKTPGLKRVLLSLYQRLNGAPKERVILSRDTLATLRDFYKDDIRQLVRNGYIDQATADNWLLEFEPQH